MRATAGSRGGIAGYFGTEYDWLVSSDGATGAWKLDEASGTTIAAFIGSVTGTYTGTITYSRAKLLADGGTAIKGNGGDRTGGDITISNPSGSASLELWYKPASTGTQWIVECGTTTGNAYDGSMAIISPNISINKGGTWTSSGISAVAGTVYHLVWTGDGTNLRFYVDAVLKNTIALTSYKGLSAFLHQVQNTIDSDGDGDVDYISWYGSTALSQAQITNHRNAGL